MKTTLKTETMLSQSVILMKSRAAKNVNKQILQDFRFDSFYNKHGKQNAANMIKGIREKQL